MTWNQSHPITSRNPLPFFGYVSSKKVFQNFSRHNFGLLEILRPQQAQGSLSAWDGSFFLDTTTFNCQFSFCCILKETSLHLQLTSNSATVKNVEVILFLTGKFWMINSHQDVQGTCPVYLWNWTKKFDAQPKLSSFWNFCWCWAWKKEWEFVRSSISEICFVRFV